jgi:hypothetical protein
MSALDNLKGQVLLEVIPEPGNIGLRFSGASLGVFAGITGAPLETLIGRSIIAVRHVEGQVLELEFLGASCLRIDLAGPGPEAFSLHFPGGPIVVG